MTTLQKRNDRRGTLAITRRVGERLVIGADTVVEVAEVSGQQVRLRITAPADVQILREELLKAPPPIRG